MTNPLPADNELMAKPFAGHLEDLRKLLAWCLLVYAAGALVCMPLTPWLLGMIQRPLGWAGITDPDFLRVLDATGGFRTAVRLVGWGGLVVSAPLMMLGIAWFVFPGLTRREQGAVRGLVLICLGLFGAGVWLAWRWVLPVGLRWLLTVNDWMGIACTFMELSAYLAFALQVMLGFGLAFQAPVILMGLGALGVLSAGQLRHYRRHAIVVLMGFAMVMTPPDPWTMLMMSAPLIGLYELSILGVAMLEARTKRR